MSDFDVAVGLSEATLNGVVKALYGSDLRDKLLSGSQPLSFGGVDTIVSWSVEQQPSIKLEAPQPDRWKTAIKADGQIAAPAANAFVVRLPALKVGRRQANGAVQETVTALDVVCTLGLEGGSVALRSLAVDIDLGKASALDKAIYTHVLIPAVLKQVEAVLEREHLPDIAFQGLSFGPANVAVGSGRMIGVARLADRGGPPAPMPRLDQMPQDDFFVLLGPDAIKRVADKSLAQSRGHALETTGSASFQLGTANYSARVVLDAIDAMPRGGEAVLDVSASFKISASAGVSIIDAVLNQMRHAADIVRNGIVDTANKAASGIEDAGRSIAHFFGF